jgi:hypothetical protein
VSITLLKTRSMCSTAACLLDGPSLVRLRQIAVLKATACLAGSARTRSASCGDTSCLRSVYSMALLALGCSPAFFGRVIKPGRSYLTAGAGRDGPGSVVMASGMSVSSSAAFSTNVSFASSTSRSTSP